jgi:tetratricopeptide (TPR) repeat protein
VKALLVTGRGGEGKTRLAVEFSMRSKREGWVGGLVQSRVSPDQIRAAAYPARPLLLVVDYAAARAAGTRELIRAVVRARPRFAVRLLLLARAGGQWWNDLSAELEDDLSGLSEEARALDPLLAASSQSPGQPGARIALDRDAVFRSAARGLAVHLAPFTGQTAVYLQTLADGLVVPDLSGRPFEHALTVQMAALAALLQQADPVSGTLGGGVEDALLAHERKYRDLLAARYQLDDLRSVRDRAVAGAALFGARGDTPARARQAACSVVAAALTPDLDDSMARQRDVAAWISQIYPPDEREPGRQQEYWGSVLPDRLGEFMVIALLASEVPLTSGQSVSADAAAGGVLESLAVSCDAPGAARALLILSRAAGHDPQAGTWVERLVNASPRMLGAAALDVATYAENPAPLRAALVRLGATSPRLLEEIVGPVVSALPRFSLQGMEAGVGLTREVTHLYRELARLNRDAYLPNLAISLNNHAVRLAQAGRQTEAIGVSDEGVAAYRELARLNNGDYVLELAASLDTHANLLAETGRWIEAVQVSEEAVALGRKLVALDREAYLDMLARSLGNHAAWLGETRRLAEAVAVSEESLAMLRELAALDRDAFLPSLSLSLNNHAAFLWRNKRLAEAVAVSEESLAMRRELAALDRDVYLRDLAVSLSNHAVFLREMGRWAEAAPVSEEAVATYRELAAVNRDAFLPGLAGSLVNYAAFLREMGRWAEAAPVSEEAVASYRELAAVNRYAHLPNLAKSLTGHADGLAKTGRQAEAVPVWEEAVASYRELAALDRDAYLPDVAKVLGSHAAGLAETGRQAEAVRVSEEAVALGRELVALDRDAYRPDVAINLHNHATLLARMGQQTDAVAVSEEAVAMRRELASLSRDAYLPDLAASLKNHVIRLERVGRLEAAVAISREAVSCYWELAGLDRDGNLSDLAGLNRDAYLSDLAGSLYLVMALMLELGRLEEVIFASFAVIRLSNEMPGNSDLQDHADRVMSTLRNAYKADPNSTDAAFRKVAGKSFPDRLK